MTSPNDPKHNEDVATEKLVITGAFIIACLVLGYGAGFVFHLFR